MVAYGAMDAEGLVNMDGNEVVISRTGTRSKRRVRLGRLLLQAKDSINILSPLLLGHELPITQNISYSPLGREDG